MSTRRLLAAGTASVLFGALGVVAASSASAEFVPVSTQVFSGTATGSYIHVTGLQAGATGPRLANADVGYANAAVNSQGLSAANLDKTTGDIISPALPTKMAYARGAGVNVGLGDTVPVGPAADQIQLQTQTATAPPDTVKAGPGLIHVPGSPLVYADAARGAAGAIWSPDTCVLNQPITAAQGYVADAQLLNSGSTNKNGSFKAPVVATDTTVDPTDNVGSTTAFQFLQRSTDSAGHLLPGTGFSLVSEIHQVLAPVTLFKGTTNELTLRVLGTWILKVAAGGVPGSTWATYAPSGDVTPSTPVLQIIQGGKTSELTLQQILGKGGIVNDNGIIIHIGAPPTITKTGDTSVKAEADAVLLQIPTGAQQLAQVAVGHMEGSATVPAGGINCQIPVTKTSAATVPAGSTFNYTVTIFNPTSFNCTLDPVVVDDKLVTVSGSPTYAFTGSSQPGFTIAPDGHSISWANVGPIASGDSKTFTIAVNIPSTSAPGEIEDQLSINPIATICKGNSVGSNTGIVSILTNSGVGGGATFSSIANSPTVTVGANHSVMGPAIGLPTVVAGSKHTLAFTGSNPLLPIAGVVLMALAGTFGWRRFRSRTDA